MMKKFKQKIKQSGKKQDLIANISKCNKVLTQK